MLRQRGLFAGAASAALLAAIGAIQAVTAQSGDRTISLYNIHTKETISVVYKRGGKFVDAGLERVNHAMRDWRRNEATKMDPELVDLLWEMHRELGSKEPIHIISGYRSRATNDQLRSTVGGQASESRHILGKAADVHFPDVPVKHLRYSALVRERGGVGYYPTSAIPFVHVDTDRVRSWPRLPRYELALLFPHGASKHLAADGGAISKDDVRIAQSRHGDLAQQIAMFHSDRQGLPRPALFAQAQPAPAAPVAPASPAAPAARLQTAALPPAAAPSPEPPKAAAQREFVPLSSNDRNGLTALVASMEPRLVVGPTPAKRPAPQPSLAGNTPVPGILDVSRPQNAAPKVAAVDRAALPAAPVTDAVAPGSGAWVPAAAFDEEHPEELSYRPFPIAPFLTASASEPLMAELVHPDVGRTLDMLDQQMGAVPMRFRPGEQTARLMWSQQFTGDAIVIGRLREPQDAAKPSSLQSRPVKTSQR